MPQPVPTVDYTRTARRPAWDDLPREVHVLTAELCGAEIAAAGAPSGGGFTNGYAGFVRLSTGAEVFVKAGGSANPFIVPSYRREAEVLPLLPAGVPAPELLATGELEAGEETWRVLVSQAIRGHMPGGPWTDADLESVHRACLVCAAALTPAPPGLTTSTLADQFFGNPSVATYFHRLGALAVPLTWGQPEWLPARAAELATLVERGPDALQGDTATHADVRGDNVVVDPSGQSWLVDWNWLCLGPAWTDYVGVLPLARADGLDVDTALRRSPLTRGVSDDDIDTWLALIAAFMLNQADDEVWAFGPPDLRVHQRRYARTFLDWLGARRGWC